MRGAAQYSGRCRIHQDGIQVLYYYIQYVRSYIVVPIIATPTSLPDLSIRIPIENLYSRLLPFVPVII